MRTAKPDACWTTFWDTEAADKNTSKEQCSWKSLGEPISRKSKDWSTCWPVVKDTFLCIQMSPQIIPSQTLQILGSLSSSGALPAIPPASSKSLMGFCLLCPFPKVGVPSYSGTGSHFHVNLLSICFPWFVTVTTGTLWWGLPHYPFTQVFMRRFYRNVWKKPLSMWNVIFASKHKHPSPCHADGCA